MVLCEKSLSKFSSKIYVLKLPESEKMGFFVLILENTVENKKFYFSSKYVLYEIDVKMHNRWLKAYEGLTLK